MCLFFCKKKAGPVRLQLVRKGIDGYEYLRRFQFETCVKCNKITEREISCLQLPTFHGIKACDIEFEAGSFSANGILYN